MGTQPVLTQSLRLQKKRSPPWRQSSRKRRRNSPEPKTNWQTCKLKRRKECAEDRLEKTQQHLEESDSSLAKKVEETQNLKIQQAHMEGKLAVWERLQDKPHPTPYAGEPQQSEQICEENTGQSSENIESGENPAANLGNNLASDELPSKSGGTRAITAYPKAALKIPTFPAWDSGSQKEVDGVNVFLPRLAQYLETQGVSKEQIPHNVFPFLKGKAFQAVEIGGRNSCSRQH